MKNQCKFSEKIYMYFNDELKPEDSSMLMEHLKNCKECKEEFDILEAMQKELNAVEEVKLPEEFNRKLHHKLVETAENSKANKRENYIKYLNRLIPAAAAVIVLAVVVKGLYIMDPVFNRTEQLSNSSNAAIENIAGGAGNKADYIKGKDSNQNIDVKADQNTEAVKDLAKDRQTGQEQYSSEGAVNNGVVFGKRKAPENTESVGAPEVMKKSAEPETSLQDSQTNAEKNMKAAGSKPDTEAPVTLKSFDLFTTAADTGELSFTTIDKGQYCGYNDRNNCVVNTKEEWEKLWQNMNPDEGVPPEVDFSKSMVIAVFQGLKNTGGYGVEITGVTETENNVEVTYKETVPPAGAIVTMNLTAPYDIVSINKTDKEIVFKAQ